MASGVRADGTVSAGSRPSRVGGIRIHRLGGESLLYAPERGVAHALNGSAAAIWELCDGGRTVREITEELARCVARDASELAPDVILGVARLVELGLVQLV